MEGSRGSRGERCLRSSRTSGAAGGPRASQGPTRSSAIAEGPRPVPGQVEQAPPAASASSSSGCSRRRATPPKATPAARQPPAGKRSSRARVWALVPPASCSGPGGARGRAAPAEPRPHGPCRPPRRRSSAGRPAARGAGNRPCAAAGSAARVPPPAPRGCTALQAGAHRHPAQGNAAGDQLLHPFGEGLQTPRPGVQFHRIGRQLAQQIRHGGWVEHLAALLDQPERTGRQAAAAAVAAGLQHPLASPMAQAGQIRSQGLGQAGGQRRGSNQALRKWGSSAVAEADHQPGATGPAAGGPGDAAPGRRHHRRVRRHVDAVDAGQGMDAGQILDGGQILVAGPADQLDPGPPGQGLLGLRPGRRGGGPGRAATAAVWTLQDLRDNTPSLQSGGRSDACSTSGRFIHFSSRNIGGTSCTGAQGRETAR